MTRASVDDDDIDFEPTTEDSDELEYFEAVEEDEYVEDDDDQDTEGDFQGGRSVFGDTECS